jgi:hypothetical protein
MKELEILDIPISDIEDNPYYERKFEEFDKEDIKQLSKSFRLGLLQPIIVRKNLKEGINGGKKYQLIAGKRRIKAVQLDGKDTIQAKIVEADDIESRIMSLSENYHRKDLTIKEKEKSIYNLWMMGNEKGIFPTFLEMEGWTGIPHQILSDIFSAERERSQDDSEEIQLASYKDLQRTKILKDYPAVRKLLLRGAIIHRTVKIFDITEAAKIIKKFITDLNQLVLLEITRLFINRKIKLNNLEDFLRLISSIIGEEDQKKVINKIIKDSEEEKINLYKLEHWIDVYNDSYDDIKEKLLNNNITADEALDLNFFELREQREKLLEELRKFDKEIKYIEKEKEKYIKEKQEALDSLDVKLVDGTTLIEAEKNKETNKILKQILKVKKDLIFFDSNQINNYDNEMKDKALEMVWEVYNHFHDILVELGEIPDEEEEIGSKTEETEYRTDEIDEKEEIEETYSNNN